MEETLRFEIAQFLDRLLILFWHLLEAIKSPFCYQFLVMGEVTTLMK